VIQKASKELEQFLVQTDEGATLINFSDLPKQGRPRCIAVIQAEWFGALAEYETLRREDADWLTRESIEEWGWAEQAAGDPPEKRGQNPGSVVAGENSLPTNSAAKKRAKAREAAIRAVERRSAQKETEKQAGTQAVATQVSRPPVGQEAEGQSACKSTPEKEAQNKQEKQKRTTKEGAHQKRPPLKKDVAPKKPVGSWWTRCPSR